MCYFVYLTGLYTSAPQLPDDVPTLYASSLRSIRYL